MYHTESDNLTLSTWTHGEFQTLTTLDALGYEFDIMKVISTVMLQHDGSVERIDPSYIRLLFPAGTKRYGLYPRIYSSQYEIVFPDSFAVYQTITRDGISIVQFPENVFPEELLLKYQQR